VLAKIEGSGGTISLQTCREQILYEVLNPSSYVTPDVTADFTSIHFDPEGPDRMRVSGGMGKPRPGDYKVSIGVDDGVIAEAQISYAGSGALARATLARAIGEKRLAGSTADDLRVDFIGLTSMHGSTMQLADPYEVRLRAAARFTSRSAANCLIREVESLYLNGPAGGAGVTFSVRENIAIVPALIARDVVVPSFWLEES
jgi:hypothetical protein